MKYLYNYIEGNSGERVRTGVFMIDSFNGFGEMVVSVSLSCVHYNLPSSNLVNAFK